VRAGRGFERTLIALVGATGLAAALLATLEAHAGGRSERASAEATRRAAALFEDIASTGLDLRFKIGTLRSHLLLQSSADIRGVLGDRDSLQEAVARAEGRAAARLAELDERSLALPTGARGLAVVTDQLGVSTIRQQAALGRQQNAAEVAERFGRRQGRAVLGLAALASAGALFGLAGVFKAGRPGWVALGTGALVLALALGSGVSALLI